MFPRDLFTKCVCFPQRKQQKQTEKTKPTPIEPAPRIIPTPQTPVTNLPNAAGSASPPWGKYYVPPANDRPTYTSGRVNEGGGGASNIINYGSTHRDHTGGGGVDSGCSNGGGESGGGEGGGGEGGGGEGGGGGG